MSKVPDGDTGLTSPAAEHGARPGSEGESKTRSMVLPNEGNEVRQEERWGFGATHSTGEAGEPAQRDPAEGRGCRDKGPQGGKMV